jgi:hypothetical protein
MANPTPQPWNPRYIQINLDVSGYRYIWIYPDTSRIYPDVSRIHPDISKYIRDISGYIQIHPNISGYIWDVSGYIWDISGYIWDVSTSGYIWIYLDISGIPRLGGSVWPLKWGKTKQSKCKQTLGTKLR